MIWNLEFRIWNFEKKMDKTNKIKSFTDLEAWKEAHKLTVVIYKATKNFPKDEIFGLTNQIRRAAVSIASNIAEGFSRESFKEKVKFFLISRGSITELQSQLAISRDIGYLKEYEFQTIAERTIVVHKLMNGLIKKTKDFY